MKTLCIKYKNDKYSFRFAKMLGMSVIEIEDLETIDNKLEELKKKDYTSVMITNEVASFSENIINKYSKDSSFNIIIIPNKRIKK